MSYPDRKPKPPVTRREFIRRVSALAGSGAALGWQSGEHGVTAVTLATAAAPAASGVSAPPPGSTLLLWDGPSGVSADYFNYGAKLPWENKAGDWSDATQVAQGDSAYATLTFNSVGPGTAPITDLVKRWYSNVNTGIYLKCTRNSAYVATRTNSDASLRPVVTLTLSDSSTIDLACAGSGVANTSTAYPVVGDAVSVQAASPMVLQFTLTSLGTRTITSATLKLYATQLFGATTCSVFELRPPKFFGGGTPVLGLADKYPLDSGIAKDPQVYFATKFNETGWRSKWFPIGALASDAAVSVDPGLQTPALTVTYHKGDFSPCSLDHMWSQRIAGTTKTNAAGTLKTYEQILPSQYDSLNNQDCPSEVYFRYYLKLLPNYECMVTGKKLPGLAGRYGFWHGLGPDSGYYQAVDGNGGEPTKGTKILKSGYPNGFYYSGWSMRNTVGEAPTDANPYASLAVSYTYAYHAAMQGPYGDSWRWGSREAGWVSYALDRWYCIEQYVKLNTLSGPFDSLGNGVGNANGILRCWVDGVLAFEKTDVVYRKHPAIRIDEIWLDHYHGGTLPAEHDHTFKMANLVVASAYIGPMHGAAVPGSAAALGSAAVPLWMKAMSLNRWTAIAGTELMGMDCSAQIAAGLTNSSCSDTGYGNPRAGILAYSGGGLKTAGSELLIFGGGGAGAWAGNDVRGLRLEDDTPRWRTRVKPTAAPGVPSRSAGPTPYMLDGVTPNARHSYWSSQFIDAQNKLMVFGCVNTWNGDTGRFNVVDAVSLDTGLWEPPGTHPEMPLFRGWDGNWICKHPLTEDVYASGASGVYRWVRATNAWSTLWTSSRPDIDRGTAAIDPRGGGTLLRIGNHGDANVPLAIDLATGTATVASFSGPYARAIAIGDYFAAGLVYDQGLGKFLLFQDDGYLYTITKVTSANWSVDRLALTGTPPQPSHSASPGVAAIWGRMQYVPNLKGVCILQAHDRPAYFVKTT